jgi:lipopolysaccharide export system ATP-binding protein
VKDKTRYEGTLVAHGLSKTYDTRRVVNGVSLVVRRGEAVGLLGPNGAGKTTCFYMIVGLVAGRRGQHRTRRPGHDRRCPCIGVPSLGVGYLPQEASIFRKPDASSRQHPRWSLRFTTTEHSAEASSAKLDVAAGRIPGHPRGRPARQPLRSPVAKDGASRSRGRLPTVRAFMLLDEPFAGVDPISVSDIQNAS